MTNLNEAEQESFLYCDGNWVLDFVLKINASEAPIILAQCHSAANLEILPTRSSYIFGKSVEVMR